MYLSTTVRKRDMKTLEQFGAPLRVGAATMAGRILCAYAMCNPNCKISHGHIKKLAAELRDSVKLSVPESAIEYLEQKSRMSKLPFDVVAAIILQKAISHITSDVRFQVLLNGTDGIVV